MNILTEALLDTCKLIPFLFATYLCLEYIEHKTTTYITRWIQKANLSGPLVGSLCGAIPQCGFSVVASNFYAAGIISLGTLIAIYLSTSDEMLPILISSNIPISLTIKIVIYKIICGILCGYLIAFLGKKQTDQSINIEEFCRNENCHCNANIWRSALYHTLRISLFIFLITLFFNAVFSFINLQSYIININTPIIGELLGGLFGLIPNCSASVILTQLFVDNHISLSILISGTLTNAGVGLIVLFRVNRRLKENLKILFLTYICGVIGGIVFSCIY